MKEHSKRAKYVENPEYYEPLYKKESPNKLELRLSNECNLACRFCTPINSSIYEKEMIKLSNTDTDTVTADYIEGLMRELDKMIGDEEIGFHREHRQICINTHKDFKDPRFKGTRDYMIGTGSLVYDWSDKYKYRKQQIKLPKEYQENQRLEEKDFNIVSPVSYTHLTLPTICSV